MLLPELWPLKYQKWITFCIFCWLQLKISPTLDKILKCIWKVLFSSFRKCYELLGSGMLLARHQHWKIQKFGILLLTQQFVFDVSTHNISGKVKSKAYWPYHFFLFLFHTISLQELINQIFPVHLNILPKLWLIFCCYQEKIWKMRHFWHFKDHNSGSKHHN